MSSNLISSTITPSKCKSNYIIIDFQKFYTQRILQEDKVANTRHLWVITGKWTLEPTLPYLVIGSAFKTRVPRGNQSHALQQLSVFATCSDACL